MINVIILAILALLIIGLAAAVYLKRRPKTLDNEMYLVKWKELQGFCKDRKTWPDALRSADQLLDTALRARKMRGKTMGERMASASRVMSNNDAMWFAHNLCKKLAEKPTTRLKEAEVKAALVGFRQALKDIGALETTTKQTADAEGDKA